MTGTVAPRPRAWRASARRGVKRVVAGLDRLRPPPRGVVVLIYHRVGGGSALELDLPLARFTEQMGWLAERGVATSIDGALDALARGPGSPPDPVVVTFDDGTSDFVDHAMPVLERFGIPVTLYLATSFVDRGVPLPYGAPPTSWAALRDAMTTGLLTVGSHTHTHALLDRANSEVVERELDAASGLIEDRLGIAAEHFAYPKALPGSAMAAAAVAARFRSAALAGTRPNRFGATDPHALARSPIQAADGMEWFRYKALGGMAWEDSIRRSLDRVRHRHAAW